MADYKKSSVHCHSTLCDGKNTLQEMAGAACAQGLTTLGFSGHSYTKPDREYCMTPGRTALYRATIAKLAFFTAANAMKACMIPHTVPNRPIYGLIEPTVASKGKLVSRSSTSRDKETRIAR